MTNGVDVEAGETQEEIDYKEVSKDCNAII